MHAADALGRQLTLRRSRTLLNRFTICHDDDTPPRADAWGHPWCRWC